MIGVMGAGESATQTDRDNAYQLGNYIAQQGWVLLTGGRNVGVMDAASRGAKAAGGLTIGILPDSDSDAVSDAVDVVIITGMGSARNNINVLSSHVVVACGVGLGTVSEVALALKANKPVILLNEYPEMNHFFSNLSSQKLLQAPDPLATINLINKIFSRSSV